MTSASFRRPHAVRVLLWFTTALLGLFAVHSLWPFGGAAVDTFFARWLNSVLSVAPGLCVLAHAWRRPRERAPWMLLGLAATLWGVGNTYFLVAFFYSDTVPIPSLADAFWIAFYVTAYVAIVLLMRKRIAEFRGSMWLDGLIGATAVAALATAIVFDAVLASAGGSSLSVATNLSYPLAD